MGTAPAGTAEYSPPGQLYTEDAPALAHVFVTGEATVSDLVTDRWGTWISVLVPLRDSSAGHMLAVFGMDIDASDWMWSVRLRALLPAVLAIVLVFLLLMVYLVLRNRQRVKTQHFLIENNNELRESERKTRAILDQSHQFIGMMTTEGVLIDVNRTALEFFGVRESDVLNMPFWETSWWSHSTDLQERLKVAITKAASGEFVGFEATHLSADGGLRIIDFSLGPVKDETGKVLFIIPQGHDITERKRAEETLRASEERLTLALDAANDGLWDWDVDSGAAFFSPRYYTMLGYEPGGFEASYLEWRNRVHPDDLARVETHLSGYLDRVEPAFEVEFRFRDNGGGWRWILARGKAVGWSQEGLVTRMVGTHVDITERKRLELHLADQLAFQQALMDTIPYAVFYKNAETQFVGCNKTYEETFGILRKDFIGKRVLDLEYLPEQARRQYQAEDEATIASVGRVRKEMPILFADGLVHQTLYSVNGFRQVDGTPGGLIGVIVDITDLKRVEMALRESEARYRSVIENIQDMYYRTDIQGRLVLLSPSTPKQLGYDSIDEILGRPASDFWMRPELRQDLLSHIKAEGTVKDYEVLLKTKDGSSLLVSTTSAYYRDDGGNVLGVEGIFRDITERRRAEESLRAAQRAREESDERFLSIVRSCPLGIHMYTMSGQDLVFAGANPSADSLLGIEHSQLVGQSIATAFPGLMDTAIPEHYRQAALNGVPWTNEQVSYSDGHISGAFEVHAFQTTPGSMAVMFTEVSERLRTAEALRIKVCELETLYVMSMEINSSLSVFDVKERAFQAVVKAVAPDLALLFSGQGDDLLLTNFHSVDKELIPALFQGHKVGNCLCGMACAEKQVVYSDDISVDGRCTMPECRHAGIRSFAALPLIVGNELVGVLAVASLTPRQFTAEHVFLESIGSMVAAGLRNATLHEELKKSRDGLEQRVAERTRELTEANARLTELDSLKSAFLNTVSHDLRTPLTSILGFSKIIKRDFTRRFIPLAEGDKDLCDKASQLLDNLGVIVSEGERLTRLVNDFLDLSRIEEGRYTWKDKTTDMGILIEETVFSLKGALLQNPDVQMRVDIAPNLPELYVDPDGIAQVLTNLLSNAIKFTTKGTVTLMAKATPESVRVSVADTGVGIPQDELPKVFDKFYQVNRDTLLAKKGTGLGLAICKQIVERYDGTIWAESTLGVGSVFSFELPLASTILKQ